jgi:integrase
VRDIARKRGKTIEEAAALVRRFSGHSLRAGFVTSAAAVDVPPLRIAQHTRHKSLEMVNRYVRESDKYTRSALKGIFAPATETQS